MNTKAVTLSRLACPELVEEKGDNTESSVTLVPLLGKEGLGVVDDSYLFL